MTSKERFEMVDAIAMQDAHYKNMLIKVKILEERLEDVLHSLSYNAANIIWDYIMYCEDMSHYVLQLACNHMVFPEESGRAQEKVSLTNENTDNKFPHLHRI